ncbi:MAG: ATP-binding cassette domain-containing protein [Planctomycetota bacterium]
MTKAIEMRGVRKTFGKKVAVEGLDLEVELGGLTGLIGPNGAGKTTSIRMVMAILFPDKGELSILGKKSAVESKDQIGYLPEERGVYKKMKVGAFIKHMARLKGLPFDGIGRKVGEWLERVDLPGVADKKCEELSKGMQQKVQFIASVIHEPKLLILDEPFSGLDPVNMRLLRELIKEQQEHGTTVIFSTHVMFQAEQVCDKVVMIHQGHKVLDDSIDAIKARVPTRSVLFDPLTPNDTHAAASAVSSIGGVDRVDRTDRGHEAHLMDGVDAAEVLRRIASEAPVARVELRRPTLEDVFVDIVAGGSGDLSEEQLRAQLREGGKSVEVEEEVSA